MAEEWDAKYCEVFKLEFNQEKDTGENQSVEAMQDLLI